MNELLHEAEALQNLLVSAATGGSEDGGEFLRLRQVLLSHPPLDPYIPRFIRTCRGLGQFWQFIKEKYPTYAERRTFLWDEFRPMLELLERGGVSPADQVTAVALEQLNAAHVQATWSKALDRRASDPEGAITMARTLLESVCKHILDEASVPYDDGADLNKRLS